MPESAIKFVTYDLIKGVICTDPDNVTKPQRLVAGCVAGAASQLIVWFANYSNSFPKSNQIEIEFGFIILEHQH
jgi:hypothetical protein